LAPLIVCEFAQVIRLSRSNGVTILLIEQNMKLAEEVANEIAIMGIRLGFERDRGVLEGPRALCILGISRKFCSDPKIAHGQSPMGKFGNAFEPYREMTVEELFPLAAARPRAGRPAGAAPGLQLGEGAGGRFSHTSRYQRGAGCYARARLRADPRA
jgi:hypothetical protein